MILRPYVTNDPIGTAPSGSDPMTHRTVTPLSRSITMYVMHEALARDRMRESQQRSREMRLARELAAQRRWHRVSRYARAAESRHAERVHEASAR